MKLVTPPGCRPPSSEPSELERYLSERGEVNICWNHTHKKIDPIRFINEAPALLRVWMCKDKKVKVFVCPGSSSTKTKLSERLRLRYQVTSESPSSTVCTVSRSTAWRITRTVQNKSWAWWVCSWTLPSRPSMNLRWEAWIRRTESGVTLAVRRPSHIRAADQTVFSPCDTEPAVSTFVH